MDFGRAEIIMELFLGLEFGSRETSRLRCVEAEL